MAAEVEFYEDESGGHRWRVRAGNGEIVATGEGHTTEADANRAFLDAAQAFVDLMIQAVRIKASE